jgi:hypothetical protein
LVGWAQPDSIPAYEEFARQFVEELDYVQERRHLQAVYAAIMPTFGHVVAIPEALPHLCTPKVLTMTMLDGPKLEEEARRQLLAIGVDVSSGNVSDIIKRSATATVSTGEGTNSAGNGVTTDTLSPPVAAPIQPRFASVGRLVVRILGVERSLQLWANLAWSWNVLARQIGAGAEASSNNATVTTAVTRGWMDTLLEVHGHEVFLTDRFNADPHPGNIMVERRFVGIKAETVNIVMKFLYIIGLRLASNFLSRTCITIMNNWPATGSPCLVDLSSGNHAVCVPKFSTALFAFLYKVFK